MSTAFCARPEPVLDLDRVAVGSPAGPILQDIRLTVGRGEFVVVFGPNGAGKTTLLTVMNGLTLVSQGSVRLMGAPLTPSSGPALRRVIGYVPQYFEVDSRAPVLARDVVRMGGYGRIGFFRGLDRKDLRLADSIGEDMGISRLLAEPFGHLSGGEKKRVLIARALFQEPEILLLDEIFSWLDRRMQARMHEYLCAYHRERDITTVVVSHHIEYFRDIATCAVCIENGRLVYRGDPRTAFEEHQRHGTPA